MSKEGKAKYFEKGLFLLGGILAIAVSLIAIYKFIIKDSPPDLDIRFALSDSHEISMAPTVQSRKSEWTDPFPVGLQITNNGEQEAKDVNVSLVTARNLILVASGVKITPQLIFSKEGVDLASHQFSVPKINPGQTIHLDSTIYGTTENHIDMDVDVEFKDGVVAVIPISIALTHDIKALVSASNMQEKEVKLKLTLGKLELLTGKGEFVFQYKNKNLVKYK